MAKLSYAQLEGAWIQGGGDPSAAPLMAAIAEAESGGNPDALNATDNGGTQSSFGLWQISTGSHAPPASNWNDPTENARLAVGKYKSQGLGAWGTYSSGAYKAFMSGGTTPSTLGLTNGAGTPATAGMAASAPAGDKTCLIGFSGLSIPVVGTVGNFCMVSKVQARDIIGGILILSGGVVAMVALVTIIKSQGPASAAGGVKKTAETAAVAAVAPEAVPLTAAQPSRPKRPARSRRPAPAKRVASGTVTNRPVSVGELPAAA